MQIAVMDFETDPFLTQRIPAPFCVGFFDGVKYWEYWGDDCAAKFLAHISEIKTPLMIYAHNGGKFDFFFFFASLENPIKIINGRITEASYGIHKFRDSFAIIPVGLAQYQKEKIDYTRMEANVRHKHRAEILHYLAKDCEYLYKLVFAFVERFGPELTIGATAIKALRKLHPFERQREQHDDDYRPYYFGGRVEAFTTGIIAGNYKIIDVNSMYPYVMRYRKHPTGPAYFLYNKLDKDGEVVGCEKDVFYFARIIATNRGALPVRTKIGLDFNLPHGEFLTTSHELKIALKYGLVDIEKIVEIWVAKDTIVFDKYVEKYATEKINAKNNGDRISELFSKFLLNSAYGKFGQNPDNYFDFMLVRETDTLPFPRRLSTSAYNTLSTTLKNDYDSAEENNGFWEPYEIHGPVSIWRKPSNLKHYYDVATAASITSAARAVLLEAMHNAQHILYCDTDSLICGDFNLPVSDTELGAWKIEHECDQIAIAGKKLYAAFLGDECVKMATKGVRLSAQEIVELCNGVDIEWVNDRPSFSVCSGIPGFIQRSLPGLGKSEDELKRWKREKLKRKKVANRQK